MCVDRDATRTCGINVLAHSTTNTLVMAPMSSELAQLCSDIDRADAIYYRTGLSFYTDAQYDTLKRRLRELAPEDERLTRVGPPYTTTEMGNKVPHNIVCGSLDNTDNGILGVADWCDDMVRQAQTSQWTRSDGQPQN